MKYIKANLTGLLAAALLVACGGSTEGHQPSKLGSSSAVARSAASASDYATVVQQLYVAYFGRPADPAGLANFEASLQAAGAPTSIQDLIAAYKTNAAVKTLIDSFGTSAESQRLYSGDNTAFVTAVFNNILNRPPQAAGLAFWVGALDSGALSKGNAALSIMAGALGNTSTQGLLDAALVNRKITISASFTSSVSSEDQINSYKGATAAATVRTMLATVTGDTDATAFQSTIDSTLTTLANASMTIGDCFQLTSGVKYTNSNGYTYTNVQETFEEQTAFGKVELRSNGTRFGAFYEAIEDGYVKLLGLQDYNGSGEPDGNYVYSSEAKFPATMKVGESVSFSYTVTVSDPNPSTGVVTTSQRSASATLNFAGVENLTLAGRTFTNVCKLTSPSESVSGRTDVLWRAKGFGYIRSEDQDAQGVTVPGTRVELATIVTAP